jgi:hypothetical protein
MAKKNHPLNSYRVVELLSSPVGQSSLRFDLDTRGRPRKPFHSYLVTSDCNWTLSFRSLLGQSFSLTIFPSL